MPPEAVVKEDLLRTGIAFDEAALSDNLDGEVKPKSYFIFSFDQKPLAELGEAARRRPPEELALTGGPYELRRTIVSVRVNPGSPYRVGRREDGTLGLALEGRSVADVGLPPMPEYYRHTLANGKTVMETAPTIQWGYLDLPHRAAPLPVLRRQGGVRLLRHQPQLAPAQAGGAPLHGRQAGRRRPRGARPRRPVRHGPDEQGLHAHGWVGHEHRRRSRRGRFLRPLRAGDRGALPGSLDRQGRRAGAPTGRRPALQGLRDHDLPPELRGVGQAALRADLSRQAALRRSRGVAPADPRCGRRLRLRGT